MKLDPIDLSDDGMRETKRGKTKCGTAQFVCYENPQLIAMVAFEKSRRRTISEQNFRRFRHPSEEVLVA